MDEVVVITGPTASGKTKVSIELSKLIGAEIINADSMQIFKGCDIGTAKPSKSERDEIIHHLVDFADPDSEFSVAAYKDKAISAISQILSNGKRVVITGGTGMYIDALVRNMDFGLDDGATDIRKKYNEYLAERGPEELYSLLVARDPKAAASVHQNNTRRVIRYLEILNGFEGSLSEYMDMTRRKPPLYDYKIFILWPERDFIYDRIEKRVDKMVENGLVDEVRGLMEAGMNSSMQSMQGIGYKETIAYLEGGLDYDEYVDLLKRNTRRYAKRQYTWMNRYRDAMRIPVRENTDIAEIVEKIHKNLQKQ